MEARRIRAWVSKYASTTGVFQVDGLYSDDFPNMLSDCKRVGGDGKEMCWSLHANDWHTTEENAILDATNRLESKLKSLDKAKAKIQKKLNELKG